jgi:DNA topoisomerase-1
MRLMIVESPTKAKKIESILGYDWIVRASMGHVVDLPSGELAVEPRTYHLSYVLSPRGEQIIASLRGLVQKADEIYLASDPDREGEAIAAHIKTQLNINRYKRVTFSEITEKGIRAALQAPRQIDPRLVSAQEARRALDRLIGYRVSYPLSSNAGLSLSAGRCQSPAIRLVVERQLEIEDFKPTDHFSALAEFEDGKWSAEWKTKPFLGADDEYILDQPLAGRAASCRHFVVAGAAEKPQRKAPPAPFTTSSLLQAAGATLGYPPALTQSLAQALFESGHVTYHRTDSPNLSDDGIAAIQAHAKSEGWPIAEGPRRWPAPEGAQEAHEAIRPTHVALREAGEEEQQQALYRLIWRRAIASQLADAQYRVVTVDLEARSAGQKFEFQARSALLISQGWKIVTADDKADDEEQEEENNGQVPLLQRGTEITATGGKVLSRTTKPPRRYTETSLIRKLEQIGIGRPSTYAAIVKHICDKGYMTVQKRYLAPTSAGYSIVRHMLGQFSFIDYDFTKDLERRLDLIAEGKTDYLTVVSALDRTLDKELGRLALQTPAFPCPACGKALHLITANAHSFWGCDGYRDGCPVICENAEGKPGNMIKQTETPSDKALAFAQRIATENGLTIPEDTLASSGKLSTWINDALEKVPPRKASEKQLEFIRSIVEKHSVEPPKGWPDDVTAKEASDFIDRNVKTSKNTRTRNRRADPIRSKRLPSDSGSHKAISTRVPPGAKP